MKTGTCFVKNRRILSTLWLSSMISTNRPIYKPKKVTRDCNRTLHFFPFVHLVLPRLYNWEKLWVKRYVGTTWLKYRYKNNTYFLVIFHALKKNHLLLDVDQCEYDLYYCEANSYRSNTVGSYTCISDRKQWIKVNVNHIHLNFTGFKDI